MSTPLVSIGIPFLNCEDHLLDAVRSIFAQTYTNWELILVDDGSTDNSLEIAKSIDDSRVRVVSDGANRKLPSRLNQIVSLARGKYIARMDADDICATTRIQQQVELLEENENIDLAGTGMVYLDENDIPIGQLRVPREHDEICKQPYRFFRLCHASVMARKSWYERNAYDETIPLAQDFQLWLKSYRQSRFANIPCPLYYYRLAHSYNIKKALRRDIIASFLFKHYKQLHRLDKALFYGLLQYIKMVVVITYFVVGAREKLLDRRYDQLSNSDGKSYLKKVNIIKNTEVPLRDV